MGKQCAGSCLCTYMLISLLTHFAELGLNSYFAYLLWLNADARVWFSIFVGLLIIPLVTVHLVSAIFYLRRQGDSIASWRLVFLALLHLFQLGFYWRHISILKEHFTIMKKKSLSELFLLRCIFTFTSGLPLLLIETVMFLFESPVSRSWVLYATIGTTLFSSAWSIASYRRQYTSCETGELVLTWPGTLFRLLWRIGELSARIISLALFASLYKHWIFLVISFHWITMCLCVYTSVIASISGKRFSRIVRGMLAAYIYTFSFININRNNAAFRYSMFYIIMFFESTTLCAVWVFVVPDVKSGYRYLMMFITASSFFVCVVSMSVYFKFFHIHSSHMDNDGKQDMCVSEDCINCKLSLCAKHNKELQRPFNIEWLSKYDPHVSDDQYFKNLLQDSFVDSSVPGDRNSTISTALSNPNFEVKTLDSMSAEERRSVISFISSGTYVHRRYLKQLSQLECDAWSEYSSDSHSVSRDRFSSTGSDSDSVSQTWECQGNDVPTLLTDNWDAVPENPTNDRKSPCHSLLRKDSHNWYSDDTSTTEHTLDWSRLPVTKLAHRKYKSSTESETDSCSYCPPNSRIQVKYLSKKPDKLLVNINNANVSSEKDQKYPYPDRKIEHINRLAGKRNKISRNVNYVNDENVYMEMRLPSKLSAVYENVAFTDDILTQPEKVFKVKKDSGINSKAPWYAHSESGDSALPTETFSSSNGGDVDNESHSSIELMI